MQRCGEGDVWKPATGKWGGRWLEGVRYAGGGKHALFNPRTDNFLQTVVIGSKEFFDVVF